MEGINDETPRLAAKIAAGFTIVLIILFVMGGYAYYKAGETGDHLEISNGPVCVAAQRLMLRQVT